MVAGTCYLVQSMPTTIDLTGETALVTGAGSGIGRATAGRLANAGAAVVVADIAVDAGERVAAELQSAGGRAMFVELDVGDPSAVSSGFATVCEAFGAPTIVVNNAFAATVGPFLEAPAEGIDLTFKVILHGTLNTCREALPDMLESGRGAIVNVISEAGRVGEEQMSIYAAAKAGVAGLTKSLAREFGPRGIRVNSVSPGTTRTPAVTGAVDEARMAKMARRYPLRRLGEPEDIADGILYLCSPMSSWVTGQVLSVSGGWSMV